MDKHKLVTFGKIYLIFIVLAIAFVYEGGGFVNISLGGVTILALLLLLAGYFIYLFVKKNDIN